MDKGLLTKIAIDLANFILAFAGGGISGSQEDCETKAKSILAKVREAVEGAGLTEWEIYNAYNCGWKKEVHLVLADPIGTESKKRGINGKEAVAQAQLQAILKAIDGGSND